MREIKFRAWDNRNDRWFDYPFVIGQDGIAYRSYQGGGHVQDVTLVQFTGLKDKNGKEIYEGDIVRGIVGFPQLLTGDSDENCNFNMGGVVFWDHSGFRLECLHTQAMCDPKRDGMANYFDFIGDDGEIFREMEVIGNIYENPDLLV